MSETECVRKRLGLELPISIDCAVIELGERLGIPMLSTRAVYACTKLLATNRGGHS